MSFLFRFHRGGLEESMETLVELDSFEAMVEHIHEHSFTMFHKEFGWPLPLISYHRYDVREHQRGDPRIGWEEVWIVLADGNPVGWTNKEPI